MPSSSLEDQTRYRTANAYSMISDALTLGLSPSAKCRLAMGLDALLLVFAMWLAFALRLGDWWPEHVTRLWWLFSVAPLTALPVLYSLRVYRSVVRYLSNKACLTIARAVTLHVILLVIGIAVLVGLQGIPRSVFIIYWFVSLFLIIGSRIFVRNLFQWSEGLKYTRIPVVIYGAGKAGAELVRSLQAEGRLRAVAFVDDKRVLQGREIQGLKVYSSTELSSLIDRYAIEQVLLAIPSARRARRQEILRHLEQLPVQVKTVPALADLLSGQCTLQDVREVDIEDLLGRAAVPADERLLSACIRGKSVMITGAGGSIGSELAQQVLNLRPSRLVLFEISEYALYEIERKLRGHVASNSQLQGIAIDPVLGSVTDGSRLEWVLRSYDVQTVYHAAAYKHVPLVECNPIEGVRNNVLGTQCAATGALKANVESFILISTDKAVRPTNVMGAAKRMAELVVQGLAQRSESTRFSIVRFGNVLGSSGSVVPLFKEQISRGGPITVTHPAIIRYFMTIAEAAELVIQAGSMGRSGEVFVLDMGEPVRIIDLARRMVNLSGLQVRDVDNPDGDIEIKCTGLRPGEKLYEEVLLGENVIATDHPRIMRAQEADLPWPRLMELLKQLRIDCTNYDSNAVQRLLEDAVSDYKRRRNLQELVWIASSNPRADKVTPSLGSTYPT
jgi:FlaA1/EpsC-like NDP-sugar epimerase